MGASWSLYSRGLGGIESTRRSEHLAIEDSGSFRDTQAVFNASKSNGVIYQPVRSPQGEARGEGGLVPMLSSATFLIPRQKVG